MSPATSYLCIFGHTTEPLCISVNGVDKNIFLPKVIEKIKWSKAHLKIFSTLGCTKCNLLLVGTQPSSQEPLWRGCPRLDFWEGGRDPLNLTKAHNRGYLKALCMCPVFPLSEAHFLFSPIISFHSCQFKAFYGDSGFGLYGFSLQAFPVTFPLCQFPSSWTFSCAHQSIIKQLNTFSCPQRSSRVW